MTRRTLAALVATALTLVAVAIGCSTGRPQAGTTSSPEPRPSPTPTSSAVGTPSATPTPTATATPSPPRVGSCHRLSLQAASAPSDDRASVRCGSRHTTVTVRVGHFDPVRDGHLLGVDSRSVQQQIADHCPAALSRYLGGSRDDRRLSRFTVVWFSPTIEEGLAGATWFRCDLVALAGDERLAPLPARVKGLLGRPHALDRFGTCGTAAPDSRGFERVICSRRHSWRAVSVVHLPAGARLHARAAGATANARCKQVAANAAGGSLKYTWAFEWPTRKQWQAGQRYGFCWLPSH